jgi:hypothetical protein
MKKALLILCPFSVFVLLLSSCRYEKTYYHNKNGHIRHVRAAKYPAWFNGKERGYNKHARRVLRNYDQPYR